MTDSARALSDLGSLQRTRQMGQVNLETVLMLSAKLNSAVPTHIDLIIHGRVGVYISAKCKGTKIGTA